MTPDAVKERIVRAFAKGQSAARWVSSCAGRDETRRGVHAGDTDRPMHTRRDEAASPPARSALRRLAVAAVMPLCACGTLVQVVDNNGAPVAGARVTTKWTFHGDASVTDDEGYARIDDGWVGLAWTLQPSPLVIRTADDEFPVPYPLPSPIRLPITVTPAPVQPDAGR